MNESDKNKKSRTEIIVKQKIASVQMCFNYLNNK